MQIIKLWLDFHTFQGTGMLQNIFLKVDLKLVKIYIFKRDLEVALKYTREER